jgi:hypothetical protein
LGNDIPNLARLCQLRSLVYVVGEVAVPLISESELEQKRFHIREQNVRQQRQRVLVVPKS